MGTQTQTPTSKLTLNLIIIIIFYQPKYYSVKDYPKMNRSTNKSSMNRSTGKSSSFSGNHLTHMELMSKRHQKKKKKVMKKKSLTNEVRKKELLEEYSKLNEISEQTNKGAALVIMDIVEEINEEGMNDKRYLDIMNQLMVLHKKDDKDDKDEQSVLDSYTSRWLRDSRRNEIYRPSDIIINNNISRNNEVSTYDTIYNLIHIIQGQ
jgi:hypothetical protein